MLGFWVGKIPWRREWLPSPVFLPGEFDGQRSLAGYSPWGRKESDATKWPTDTHTYTHIVISILGMGKVRPKEIEKLAQVHTSSKWLSKGWNLGVSESS